jgi:hypothetical protein
MAEGLADGDVCARELAAEGRSAVAVAAATGNAGMLQPLYSFTSGLIGT